MVTYGESSTVALLGGYLAFGLVIVVVLVGVLSIRGRGRPLAPKALFLFGICLASLVVGFASFGVSVHAVAGLVGPASPGTSVFPITPPDGSNADGAPIGSFVSPDQSAGFGGAESSAEIESSFGGGDQTNMLISEAVEAGLFAVAALACYVVAWSAAKRLRGPGLDDGFARLGTGFGYLVAGLAAVTSLILAPLAANNVFRAIAPGVAGAAGHADGVRNAVTFATLLGVSLLILTVHLRYAASFGAGPAGMAAPAGSPDIA